MGLVGCQGLNRWTYRLTRWSLSVVSYFTWANAAATRPNSCSYRLWQITEKIAEKSC